MSLLFSPYTFETPQGPLTLPNRIVIAPMCQYLAEEGAATDWHLVHWTTLLNGGAGMLTIEATAVSPEGRISPGCLGLWDERTAAALGDRLQRARALAPRVPVCLQIGHAGRKASSAAPWHGGMLIRPEDGGWWPMGPSALPHLPQEAPPREMDEADIERVIEQFEAAARRAQALGIDAVEVHGAHGYLLHQFLSPLANQRRDGWGGDFAGRTRLLREVFARMRAVFRGALGVRLSGTDWVEGGWDVAQSTQLATELKAAGAQFVHISSAGVSPQQKIPLGPLYQVPLARQVRQGSGLCTMAVGLITEPQQAEDVLQAGDADLVALARAFLYKPRWGWEAAAALGGQVQASPQYWRSLPREAGPVFGPEARIGMR